MSHALRTCFLLVLALLVSGCQRANRYGAKPIRTNRPVATSPTAEAKPPDRLPSDYVWMEPRSAMLAPSVPIVFVHAASDPAGWHRLQEFWTVTAPPTPAWVTALLGVSPIGAALLTGWTGQTVKVKVPLGLDDPTPYLPAANPPTLGKWELGKQLFFDRAIFLQPAGAERKFACATCHDPAKGFTDGRMFPAGTTKNTPTLLNSIYTTRQFWDGRVAALEEVVQRSVEDERLPAVTDDSPAEPHRWKGVVHRLREQPEYVLRFQRVFGTPPTQDAVGKAVATYLRTLLCGNSLHDRAEQARRGQILGPRDYEKLLDQATIQLLLAPDEPRPKAEVAQQLHLGHTLFHGRAECVRCHAGGNFTDGGFHNLGIGDRSRNPSVGPEVGRFAALPIGRKDVRLIGAYRTPTLRALPRTAPYFHDGSRRELFDVVAWHVGKAPANPNLDPAIRDRRLTEGEVRALVLFLRALNGEPVPDILSKHP